MVLDYEKIIILAADMQLSVGELKKKANISDTAFQGIRIGRDSNIRTAGRMAATLGVSVTEIMKKKA